MPTPTIHQTLRICKYAGLRRQGDDEQVLGAALARAELPARKLRRFSALEKGVVACVMGLGDIGDTPLIYTSRYGAMDNTLGLLKDIIANETLSPTAFSLSVHNAAIGVASQMTQNRGAHTAVAAGVDSIRAGLVECMIRLAEGEDKVVLVYTDCQMSDEYAAFDAYTSDVQFACLLSLADCKPDQELDAMLLARPGDFLDVLVSGAETLRWAG